MKKRGLKELSTIGFVLNAFGFPLIIIGAVAGIIAVLIVGIISVIAGTVFLAIYLKRYFDKIKVGRAVEDAKKDSANNSYINPYYSAPPPAYAKSEYERRRQERDLQEKQAELKAKLLAAQQKRIEEARQETEKHYKIPQQDILTKPLWENDDEEYEDDDEIEDDELEEDIDEESGEDIENEEDDINESEEEENETDGDGESLEGAELEAYIEEENLRILQEHGDMETGRVTDVVDVQGSDNYCRVTFAVRTFEGEQETQAFMKKDAKYIRDSAHYIIIDKEDKERCTVL